MGWNVVSEELGEFVEILAPQKRVGEHWYLGTADAVYQNLYSVERERPRWVTSMLFRLPLTSEPSFARMMAGFRFLQR